MPYLVWIVLSLGVALFARRVGLDRDRAFYPTVLIVIASYYVLFERGIILRKLPTRAAFSPTCRTNDACHAPTCQLKSRALCFASACGVAH
jgi:hypothetical protein